MAQVSISGVDIEYLISLVEARPILWDKTFAIYKDKNQTRNAWIEVCIALKPDFEQEDDTEKDTFAKDIVKKWGNIRDAFLKSKKKEKKSTRSGDGVSTTKKYIYNQQLQFLNANLIDRPTHDSTSADSILPPIENSEEKEPPTEEVQKPRKLLGSRKRNLDEVEEKMLQALEERPVDRNLCFFKSITPSLQCLDEDEVLQFQMGVLQLITNIKRKKIMSLNMHQENSFRPPMTMQQFSFPQQQFEFPQQQFQNPQQTGSNLQTLLSRSGLQQPKLSPSTSTNSPPDSFGFSHS